MVRHRLAQSDPAGQAAGSSARPPAAARRKGGAIRARLMRILAFPLVAVLVLLGVVVAGDIGQYNDAKGTRSSVSLALAAQDLTHELQEERGLTSGLLGGDAEFRSDLPASRSKVDAQRGRLAQLANDGVTGAAGLRAALAALGDLGSVRGQIDSNKINGSEAFDYFTARIKAFDSVDFGLDRSTDSILRRGDIALNSLNEVKEYTAQERAFLNGVFSAGGFKPGQYAQLSLIHSAVGLAQARATAYASPAQLRRAQAVISSPSYAQTEKYVSVALAAPTGQPLRVDPRDWWSALTAVLDQIRELQQSCGADIRARADELQKDAAQQLIILAGIVLAGLAGAVVLMVVAARSITNPLAMLAAEADDLASRRLPESVAQIQTADADDPPDPPDPVLVPVRASSEIRSVAVALDRVQTTAYRLATEQALLRRTTTESLANLGRRNQNLLRRQIGFITKLEQEENDPSGLANLFELDHLATRMRRNAESLLVLVGEASPRRWSAPLPIADVIRAAVSEVEEYRRVALRRIDEAYVGGSYVTPLAHMIAELVENGLAFSPPDLDVEIQGRHVGGQYLIAITDQGVGMEPADLAKANARVRGEDTFLMEPTRFLGHYVVGYLARQMGVSVELGPSPVTGITARVLLPATVLATPGQLEAAAGQDDATPARAVPALVEPQALHGQPMPAVASLESGINGSRPIPAGLTIGGRPVPAVEYITTTGVAAPVPVPPPELLDPSVRADTTRPGLFHVEPSFEAPGAPYASIVSMQPMPHGADMSAGRTSPADPIGTPDRTRNGLAKRPPRTRHSRPEPSTLDPQDRAPELDESPQQMRDRLVSLRAGVRRGEQSRGGREAAARGQSDPLDERGSRGR